MLVNDDLNRSFSALQAILAAERLKRSRKEPAIELLADELTAELKHKKMG